jgi:hypothetical protein
MPENSEPVLVAEEHVKAVMVPCKITVRLSVQDLPPRLMAKFAVPLAFGVPVML